MAGLEGFGLSSHSVRSRRRGLPQLPLQSVFSNPANMPLACFPKLPLPYSTFYTYKIGRAGGIRSFVSLRSLQSRRLLRLRLSPSFRIPQTCHWHVSPNYLYPTQLSTHIKLAGLEGFEPTTPGFGDRCSTNWSYSPIYLVSL